MNSSAFSTKCYGAENIAVNTISAFTPTGTILIGSNATHNGTVKLQYGADTTYHVDLSCSSTGSLDVAPYTGSIILRGHAHPLVDYCTVNVDTSGVLNLIPSGGAVSVDATAQVLINNTTAASSGPAAGSLITLGGIYNTKNLIVASATAAAAGPVGAIVCTGGINCGDNLIVSDATGAGVGAGSIVTAGGINAVDLLFSGAAPQTVLNRFALDTTTLNGTWGTDTHPFTTPSACLGYLIRIGRLTFLHTDICHETTSAAEYATYSVAVPAGYLPAATENHMFILTNCTDATDIPGVLYVDSVSGALTIGPRDVAHPTISTAFLNTKLYGFEINTFWLTAA